MARNRNKPVLPRSVFHAHVALEGWAANQELDAEEHVEYLRDLYNAGADAETDLEDSEIADIRDRIEGDTAAADALRIEAIEADSVGDVDEPAADVSAVRSSGFGFGAALGDANSPANLHFVQVADSKEFLDGSPLLIATDMEAAFIEVAADGSIIRDDTETWPQPGTSYDDDDRSPDWKGARSNLQPDHYKDGKVRGSWFADYVDGSAYGKTITAVRACFAKVKGNERLNETEAKLLRDVADIPKWEALHDGKVRETEDSRWSARRSNVILRVRRAFTFLRQRDRVLDVDGVTVQFVNEDMNHVLKKREPIYLVWDNGKKGKEKKVASSSPMALTKFNRLLIDDTYGEKPKKGVHSLIAEGMPVIAAFEKTVERPPRRRGSAAEGLTIPTANVNGKQAHVMVAGLRSFFEDGRREPAKLAQLVSELSGPNAEAEVVGFGEMLEEANTFFEPYRTAYNIAVQRRLELKQRETAERLANQGGKGLAKAS